MRFAFWRRDKPAAKLGIVRDGEGNYTSARIDGATGLPLYSHAGIRALEREILSRRRRRRRRPPGAR